MCNFFSFLTTDKGDYLYFNAKQRKELNFEMVDSHSKIAWVYYNQNKSCKVNAYEYNPITQELTKDAINFEEDYNKVLVWCKNIDFKTIVPELIIKPIVNPFDIEHDTITDIDIQRLKELVGVGVGVRASVRDSVGVSVGDSVRVSMWASIGDSVWAIFKANARVSISAYLSSFFNLDGKWKGFENVKGNPFQPCIDLWESGLVPSCDGDMWRLHSKNGIVYEMKESEVIE